MVHAFGGYVDGAEKLFAVLEFVEESGFCRGGFGACVEYVGIG